VSLIHSIFNNEEVEIIIAIPLSKYGQEVSRGESSHNSDLHNLWRLIWGLKVPNPVKMLL
jgi:hypothetical protein